MRLKFKYLSLIERVIKHTTCIISVKSITWFSLIIEHRLELFKIYCCLNQIYYLSFAPKYSALSVLNEGIFTKVRRRIKDAFSLLKHWVKTTAC